MRTSAFQDERSRISLLPTAVKLTRGRVYDAGLLLQDEPTQAVLGYAGGCRLENVPGGEKAGVLLDYGRESHGTLRLTTAAVESKKDIHGDYGAFCYEKFRHSLCHGWSNGPVPFLMRHVAGITVEEPGCRKLLITPRLGDLRFVEAEYPTPLGIVHVRHERKPDGSIESAVNVPAGITYEIREQ